MNHSYTRASDAVSADAVSTRAFLQQAVDHYPRLAAFSFTLKLPYRETLSEYRSLILRFHTEVWQRTGEYSRQRQQERHHSPPTVLRWMWEATSAPECGMIMLMNLDTLGSGSSAQHVENAMQAMGELLREAWLAVCGAEHNGVTNLTSVILNRSGLGVFTMRFSQLKATVQGMTLPVMTARSSAAG